MRHAQPFRRGLRRCCEICPSISITRPPEHIYLSQQLPPNRCLSHRRAQQPSSEYVRGEVILAANVIKPDPQNRNRTQFTMLTQVCSWWGFLLHTVDPESMRAFSRFWILKSPSPHVAHPPFFFRAAPFVVRERLFLRQRPMACLSNDKPCGVPVVRSATRERIVFYLVFIVRVGADSNPVNHDRMMLTWIPSTFPPPRPFAYDDVHRHLVLSAGGSRGDRTRVDRQPNQVRERSQARHLGRRETADGATLQAEYQQAFLRLLPEQFADFKCSSRLLGSLCPPTQLLHVFFQGQAEIVAIFHVDCLGNNERNPPSLLR